MNWGGDMALLQCSFKSEVLEMEQPLHVILPQIKMLEEERREQIKKNGFPVLYLLHGLSDDNTVWTRMTSIERYALQHGIAVVMPNVNRSFYADMKYGLKYYTYVSEEIPYIASTYFPISGRREDSFIAGLSMGGYGAFMIALRNPEKFCAAASLSGALDLTSTLFSHGNDLFNSLVKPVFGSKEEYLPTDYNLLSLIEKLTKQNIELPRLFQCCGTEDFLYEANQKFKAVAEKYGLDLTYEEGPGSHEWGYWDRNIQRVLEWMLKDR